MTPLPPSVAVILGLTIGLTIGVGGTYVLVKQGVKADVAEANLATVVDGEKEAQVIRKVKEVDLEASKQFIEKVEAGEEKIVSSDGLKFSAEFAARLRNKVIEARSVSD